MVKHFRTPPVRLGAHDRYSLVAIALHWTVAAFIIVSLLTGYLRAVAPALVTTMMGVHKPTGIMILSLTLVRVAWRIGHRPPPAPVEMPEWQSRLARVVHVSLYVLLIVVPLAGWSLASSTLHPRPLQFYWLFDLPFLPLTKSAELDEFFKTLHLSLANAMAALVVLHIAAVIKHRFIDKDELLSRMLP